MKTAFVTDRISRHAGGLFDACGRLAQELKRHGEEVRAFGVADADGRNDSRQWSPVPVHLAEPKGWRTLAWAPQMAAELADFSPDVVHTHGLWNYPSWLAARWRARSGKPEVIHPHGMLDPWALKNGRWKKDAALALFERAHLEKASCIRALCAPEREAIRALGLKVPVCVIPNGMDLPQAEAGHKAEAAAEKVLLYLGRLHPKKGLPELLKAWAQLGATKANAGWRLVIAGWDQNGHELELKQQAESLSLPWQAGDWNAAAAAPGSVFFCGPKFGSDKAALYAAASAFILPSVSEGLPMVVLEAWAHAKPVVMTPMCNLPEGVAAGAAMSIQAEASSQAAALGELFGWPEPQRAAMGEAGLQLVRDRFSWQRAAADLAAVNEWLVHGGAAPACVELV